MRTAQLKGMICSRVEVEESRIQPSTRLVEDLGMSSFDLMDLMSEVERTYNIAMDEGEGSRLRTFADLHSYVESALKKQVP